MYFSQRAFILQRPSGSGAQQTESLLYHGYIQFILTGEGVWSKGVPNRGLGNQRRGGLNQFPNSN